MPAPAPASRKGALKSYHSDPTHDIGTRRKNNGKKQLGFGVVEVHEFKPTIGANPTPSGCPIALDYNDEDAIKQGPRVMKLQTYENFFRRNRSSSCDDDYYLSDKDRLQRLMDAGFGVDEIAEASVEAHEIHRKREKTNRQRKWDSVHYFGEITSRTFRKVLSLPTSSSSLSSRTTRTYQAPIGCQNIRQ